MVEKQGVGRSGADAPSGFRPTDGAASVSPAVAASIPNAWGKRVVDGAIELVREIGIYGLGGNDGCPCTDFAVRNISVHVSCHKSEQTVRIYSHHADFDDGSYRTDTALFEPLAEEVLRQVDAYYGAGGEYAAGFKVLYRSWEDDNPRSESVKRG